MLHGKSSRDGLVSHPARAAQQSLRATRHMYPRRSKGRGNSKHSSHHPATPTPLISVLVLPGTNGGKVCVVSAAGGLDAPGGTAKSWHKNQEGKAKS